jgi:hypothetical protein
LNKKYPRIKGKKIILNFNKKIINIIKRYKEDIIIIKKIKF